MMTKKNRIITYILLLGFLLGFGMPNEAFAATSKTEVSYRYLRAGDNADLPPEVLNHLPLLRRFDQDRALMIIPDPPLDLEKKGDYYEVQVENGAWLFDGKYNEEYTYADRDKVEFIGYWTFVPKAFEPDQAAAKAKKESQVQALDPALGIVLPKDLNSLDHYQYIYGYPDGTIRPLEKLTRAEVTTIFYRLLVDKKRDAIFTKTNAFTDVSEKDWYNKAVSSMTKGKYLSGYKDGSFLADKTMTRAEFFALASRFLPLKSGEISFKDVSQTHWAREAITSAVAYGLVKEQNQDSFRPEASITRAEAVYAINRMLHRGVDALGLYPGYQKWRDNPEDAWYYYDIIEASTGHTYSGVYPNERWNTVGLEHKYDVEKYERSEK